MSTTPPPTSRVRTPPAPRLGPRHDDWEPFSPRRSTRVSSMRLRLQSPDADPGSSSPRQRPSIQRPQYSLAPTPRKATLNRTVSSQTLSPPSSPDSEHRLATPAHPSTSIRRSLFTSRNPLSLESSHPPTDSDNSHKSKASPEAMFPTPSKTPRKHDPTALAMPTARILNFKPSSLDDVMPTPRKRKSRLTLLDEDAPQPEKISVFTDAHDRIPDVDNADDNPFVGARKKGTKPNSADAPVVDDGNEADMEEAVRNNEGLIYVFRGKRIFRPFTSPSASKDMPEPADTIQASIKRKAGAGAERPLSRSTLEPRLLWPSEEQLLDKQKREVVDEDEEADTDIEQEHLPLSMPKVDKELITPAKYPAQSAQTMTPPSTHRATRSASKKLSFLSTFEAIPEITEADTQASPAPPSRPQQRAGAKKASPFETWKRTKSSASGSSSQQVQHGQKRALSPQPDQVAGRKRTRSEI